MELREAGGLGRIKVGAVVDRLFSNKAVWALSSSVLLGQRQYEKTVTLQV